eukprot:CAMPEP_0118652098 /NCGR_PEP_ID=MMETSP0785-20121206/11134_1 /TAXON_ID=91992 /ORGANISM="Bolidomonas pacifica, Strain CCMP 1866" /LENGTH=132 /DNA_ID=CAMNT_0006544587 /DNA_START=217 /DNA_END=616 /DNA_ORIENTATION=+
MGSAQELRPHLGEVGKRYLAPAIYALSASLVILGSVKCDLGIVGVHGLFAEGAFAQVEDPAEKAFILSFIDPVELIEEVDATDSNLGRVSGGEPTDRGDWSMEDPSSGLNGRGREEEGDLTDPPPKVKTVWG